MKSDGVGHGQHVVDDARRGPWPSGELDRGSLPRPDPGKVGLRHVGDEGEGRRVREREDLLVVGHAIARGRRVREDDSVGRSAQLGADQVSLGQRAGARARRHCSAGVLASRSISRAPDRAASLSRDTMVPTTSPRRTRSPSATDSVTSVPAKGTRIFC